MRIHKSFNKKPLIISVVSLYTLSFIWMYIEWLYPVWEYAGYDYSGVNFTTILQIILFCVLPSFWIPLELTRPSLIIYWLLFLLTYIPMIIGVSLSSRFDIMDTLISNIVLLIGFYFTGIGYSFKIYKFRNPSMSDKLFWSIFIVFCIIQFVYVFYVFRNTLQFVSPFSDSLYEVRFAGKEASIGTIVGYPVLWLSGSFLPFIMSLGLAKRKKILIILSIVGQFALYLTAANKAFVLSIIFMFFIFYLCKKKINIGLALVTLFSFLTIFLISTQLYFSDDVKRLFFPITSLFMIRTMAISTVNIINYFDFFITNHNPYTFLSHINIINKIVEYPYGDLAIGQVIGLQYYGSPDANYNANFYLTDGLASFGLSGIIIVGIISGVIFYLIDTISQNHSIVFTATLFSYATINLMNVSLFTSLLSGGIIFNLIMLFFFKRKST